MNRRVILLTICLILLGVIAMATDPEPWFDTQKCEFCKAFAAQPGLLEHMHHQYYNLHNGLMSVSHIDHDFQPAFANAQGALKGVVKDLQAGKQVAMCRHCSTLGSFYGMGVMPDEIKAGDEIYVVYTSTDTSVVRQLQEFGKNSADALAAMEKEKTAK